MLLATRIHSPTGKWWMTTGAALPVDDEALDRISHDVEDYRRRHTGSFAMTTGAVGACDWVLILGVPRLEAGCSTTVAS
jgi:hypothetical protein